jgi:hypothetical protein
MSIVTKLIDDWSVNIFVGDEIHTARSVVGYTTSAFSAFAAKSSAA